MEKTDITVTTPARKYSKLQSFLFYLIYNIKSFNIKT